MTKRGWYGIDLDGTLAEYTSGEWQGPNHIGPPVPKMLARVQAMLAEGKDVRIFTARACEGRGKCTEAIERWCLRHIGRVLPITCAKDYDTIEIYDDRAVQIVMNTGERADGLP
jgi:hypothetical protein